MTKSHVSTSVSSLIGKGLLRKEYLANNRKAEHLHLTKVCDEIINDGQMAQKIFFDRISHGISKERLSELFACFEQMDKNVLKALEDE